MAEYKCVCGECSEGIKAEPVEPGVVRPVLAKDQIELYLHCAKCVQERPRDQSPSEYSRLEVGWTKQGIQVRCIRHNLNIVHIDFQGYKHPANTAGSDG